MHYLACYQWSHHVIMSSKLQTKLTTLGYSRKNPTRGVKDIIFWKTFYFSLYSKKFHRKQAFRKQFCKIVRHALEISRSKTKTWPWKLHNFFLCTPKNSTSFLIDPWNFHTFFLLYPWKFHVHNPHPCLDFFWNSPFWGV